MNKTGHSIIVNPSWWSEEGTIEPEDIPLDQASLPVLQPKDEFDIQLNEIEGKYEDDIIVFLFYEVIEDTAYYRDLASNSMHDQFYIYYSDNEIEDAYHANITCTNNCTD